MLVKSVSSALLGVCVLVQASVGQEREELASYLEIHRSNWEAISRFDVLCRTDVLREPGASKGFTATTFERFAFDFDRDRYLYVRSGSRKDIDGETVSGGEDGFIIRDGKVRAFAIGPHPPVDLEDRNKLFDKYCVPDLRILMFMSISRGSSRTWSEGKFNAYRTYAPRATNVRRLEQASISLGFEVYYENNSGFRWYFDTGTFLPTTAEWRVRDERSENVVVMGREHFEWETRSGKSVPVQVQGTYRDRQMLVTPEELSKIDIQKLNTEDIRKLYVDVNIQRDMRLFWFEVDEELSDKLFDFRTIDHPGEFVSLADPKATNAVSLSDEVVESQ